MKIVKQEGFISETVADVEVKNVKVKASTIVIECSEGHEITLSHKEASKLVQPIKSNPIVAMKILNG